MNKALSALLAVSLAACTAMPMNPEEFKHATSEGSLGAVERFTVPLAFNTVVANLQSAAGRCLNFTTSGTLTSHGYVSLPSRVKSELHVLKPGQAQLVVQDSGGSAMFNGGKKPEGGWYTFIADIAPASSTSTNVTMYYGQIGYGGFVRNIKSWASGQDTSCHDSLF
jgi:hypothetical protein